nr:hypothetical protein BaRGS_033740 [Batillaria attramentaria]
MLPSSRIQCASGRIRVGDRTYLSASDALSAYLQQFDGKQQQQQSLRKKISEDSVEVKRSLDEYLARLSDSASKLCLDDPTLTPAKQVRMMEMAAKGVTVSPELEDLLDGDRPWENMAPSFKAPVHVGNSSPGKLDASTARPATPTLSGGQQPGSMEALKKMLFRLQTEEASGSPPSTGLGAQMENGGASSLIPALADYNFEDEPGGQSLEKALVHLGRLKTLVQTTGKKETEQDTASQK